MTREFSEPGDGSMVRIHGGELIITKKGKWFFSKAYPSKGRGERILVIKGDSEGKRSINIREGAGNRFRGTRLPQRTTIDFGPKKR